MDVNTGHRELRYATAVMLIVACWSIAAVSVFALHQTFSRTSAAGCLVAKAAVILMAALTYMRLASRAATVEHALFVGIGWTVLSILAEFLLVTRVRPVSYPLLGGDDTFRSVLILTWIGAPLLFARRQA